MPEHANPEAVRDLVREINAWYAEQLILERRAPVPDAERIKLLRDGLAISVADQRALDDADGEQVDEIASRYAALRKEFKGQ
jgi:hypothetical protein